MGGWVVNWLVRVFVSVFREPFDQGNLQNTRNAGFGATSPLNINDCKLSPGQWLEYVARSLFRGRNPAAEVTKLVVLQITPSLT